MLGQETLTLALPQAHGRGIRSGPGGCSAARRASSTCTIATSSRACTARDTGQHGTHCDRPSWLQKALGGGPQVSWGRHCSLKPPYSFSAAAGDG